MHRKSYEAVSRAPGSFSQFRRGVDLLLERGVPLVVKGTILPSNRGEMDELEAWARTIPAMTTPPSYVMLFDLRNRRDDSVKNLAIKSLRMSPEDALTVLTRHEAVYRRETAKFAARFMGPPAAELFRCGAGQGMSIDAYGRAQPCMGVRAPDLTVDVLVSSLTYALEDFGSLSEIRAMNAKYLRRCALCFLHGLCEQCPAKSWAEHGTLDTPVEYLCEVAHAQARHLGWLKEDENAWEVVDWRKRVA
jgi:radical SAM protein with 4Fe4S-binding SPASM domain